MAFFMVRMTGMSPKQEREVTMVRMTGMSPKQEREVTMVRIKVTEFL
jgi:hypothetical protein